jgi:hypothetical protein
VRQRRNGVARCSISSSSVPEFEINVRIEVVKESREAHQNTRATLRKKTNSNEWMTTATRNAWIVDFSFGRIKEIAKAKEGIAGRAMDFDIWTVSSGPKEA